MTYHRFVTKQESDVAMRETEAKRLLDAYCLQETGRKASSRRFTKEMNRDGESRDWWLQNIETLPPADGPRTRAYLRAYFEISEQRFFATGVPVLDKYMQPDRAVMKSLLLAEYVVLEKNRFVLTEKGMSLLQSVRPISDKTKRG